MHAFLSKRRTVICSALLAAAPAFAGVSGTTTIGPLAVQVYDLRPDDGIVAGASFAPSGTPAGVIALAQESFPLQETQRTLYGPWQGTAVDVATPLVAASAAVSGGTASGPEGTTMQLRGTVSDFNGPEGAFAGFNVQGALLDQGSFLQFTLTPWSAISLLIPVSSLLSTERDGDAASTSIGLTLFDAAGDRDRYDSFTLSCSGPCRAEDGRLLSVTIDNESDTDFTGRWSLTAMVNGMATVSAVPEPDALAMLLSGLGVLGFVVRRRATR